MMRMASKFDATMKRFSIRLTSWHYKRLIWWAKGKGQSISGMAERTIAARIEANSELIEDMVKDKADDLGVSSDEVKRRWLEEAKYDPIAFEGDSEKEEPE